MPAAPAAAAKAPPRRRQGRALILADVARGARLTPTYLMLAALSAALAHIGLLQNSAPVIIGAMLISPLMGPIMGLGFGLAVFENGLLRRSLGTLAAGIVVAVAVTLVLTLLSPVRDITPPILARIRPTLLDLLVAVFGGIAGAHATIRKSAIGIVGVAIATALMPPLAVIGFGLGTGRPEFAGGALLLFIANSAAIALMATATARLSGFGISLTRSQTMLQTAAIFGSLAVLAAPLAVALDGIVRQSRAQAGLRADLQRLAGEGARISSLEVAYDSQPVRLDAVVIVPRFNPALEPRWMAAARDTLGTPVTGQLLQLREDSEEAVLIEERMTRRLAESEARGRERERIVAAAAAAGGVEADDIVVDSAARVLVMPMGPVSGDAGEAAQALDTLRAAFPDWTVRRAVSLEAAPAPTPAPAPAG